MLGINVGHSKRLNIYETSYTPLEEWTKLNPAGCAPMHEGTLGQPHRPAGQETSTKAAGIQCQWYILSSNLLIRDACTMGI